MPKALCFTKQGEFTIDIQVFFDLLPSLAGGAFTGAASAGFLSKTLIKHKLDKDLKNHQKQIDSELKDYQANLDIQKQNIQTDLAVLSHQKNHTFTRYDELKVKAIENIFSAFVETSLPRAGFKKYRVINQSPDLDDFLSEYFKSYSESFDAFSKSFGNIINAFEVLENNSIYIDKKIELKISDALVAINSFYQQRHIILQENHKSDQDLYKKAILVEKNISTDFIAFYDESNEKWKEISSSVKEELKHSIRVVLEPKK